MCRVKHLIQAPHNIFSTMSETRETVVMDITYQICGCSRTFDKSWLCQPCHMDFSIQILIPNVKKKTKEAKRSFDSFAAICARPWGLCCCGGYWRIGRRKSYIHRREYETKTPVKLAQFLLLRVPSMYAEYHR